MLTRQYYAKLKDTKSLQCLCCGEYWGMREEMYICSKCHNPDLKKSAFTISKNSLIKDYQKKHNMHIISDKLVAQLVKILKNTFIMAYGAMDVAKLIYSYLDEIQNIDNPDNKLWLLSDNQALLLLRNSNWREFSDGYKISHIILRWRLNPWSQVGFNQYHKSSFCYYGNYGEVPSSTDTMDNIYIRAHSCSFSP